MSGVVILAQSRRPISTQSWVRRRSAMLTASQIPIAVSIADLRRTQDCVLMGRRDCVKITTPHI